MRSGFDSRRVIDALRTVIPCESKPGHHDPDIGLVEQDAVNECFRSGPIGYAYVDAFEGKLKEITNVRHAFACSSGTAALHLSLMALGVRPGDAVLVPSMSFVASANAVRHAGAIPVFLDSDGESMGIMPHKLKVFLGRETLPGPTGPVLTGISARIAAMIAVHVLGRPCRIVDLIQIAVQNRIPLVEDAAEALGSSAEGRPCGSWGSIGVYSFNHNKIASAGGGGAVVTNSEALDHRVRRLGTTARVPHWFEVAHDDVAWNYRMPNLCAAFGLAQLERLPLIVKAKRALAHAYQGALCGVKGVQFMTETGNGESNRWLNCMMVDPRWRDGRMEIAVAMRKAGMNGRALFTPLHTLPMYCNEMADNPLVAVDLHKRAICLPSGAALGRRFM